MAKNVNHVSHIKSKQIVNGKPKLPDSSILIEGEIAINFGEGVETISTKNENGNIVTFSSDNYYTEQKLGSGFTSENSGRTVTEALESLEITVDQVIDETTSASTNPVATKAVYNAVTNNENELASLRETVTSHTANTTIHVTSADKTKWNNVDNKQDISGMTAYTTTAVTNALSGTVTAHTANTDVHVTTNDKSTWNTVTAKTDTSAFTAHTANSVAHITSSERTTWNAKLDASDIVNFFDNVKYEDSGTTKVINFYHGNTIKATVDATDFIKDGMIDKVELETKSGTTYLVITWNTDAGKTVTELNIGDIFEADNYLTKEQLTATTNYTTVTKANSANTASTVALTGVTDADDLKAIEALNGTSGILKKTAANTWTLDTTVYSSATEVNTALNTKANTATTLGGYGITDAYTKSETSGATEISNALEGKVNVSDVVSAITPDNSGSTNPVAVRVIAENEKIISESLVDLDSRKLDASAYTPTDLSNYYTKDETSGKTELSTAFNAKANTATTLGGYGITDAYTKSETSGATELSTAFNSINTSIEDLSGQSETVAVALNSLNETKLDVTAYTPTDLSDYYKKSETSGKTEISSALGGKVDNSTFTAHTASTSHMNSTEKTNLDSLATNIGAISGITSTKVNNWDGAASNSHTHPNKATLDAITASSTAINSLTGSVGTMAFENKTSYSSATEVNTALGGKVNTSDVGTMAYEDKTSYTTTSVTNTLSGTVTAHTANTDIHVTTTDKSTWNTVTAKTDTSAFTAHTANTTAHITANERTSWNAKLDASAITEFFDGAKYENSGTTKVINFYHGTTIKATIDASEFIKDGMVDSVVISGGNLVITFNTDSGKQPISIPLTDIFDPSNYYTKSETSGKTEISTALATKVNTSDIVTSITPSNSGSTNPIATKVVTENEKVVTNALTSLDERVSDLSGQSETVATALNVLKDEKLDVTAYTPTDLSDYYKKSETSGKTEISNALGGKVNNSTFNTHTANTTMHITSSERTAWNNKVNASDVVSAITSDNSGSTNPVATSVVAKNEKVVSNALVSLDERISDLSGQSESVATALNTLNAKKLDASAYTPTDLSDYYKKSETSGSTEISNALSVKVNSSTFTAHTANTTVHITPSERTTWNNKVNTSDIVTAITPSNSGSTNPIATSVIAKNEKVVSNALVSLDERVTDLTSQSETIATTLNLLNERIIQLETQLAALNNN